MTTFADIATDLERQAIELPSWAFGNSDPRFKVFSQPGVPRDLFEKITDAAQVHLVTGLAPSVALHIPWDRVDDWDRLREYAEGLGVRLGTINTNTFVDGWGAQRAAGQPRRDGSVRARFPRRGIRQDGRALRARSAGST